MKNSTDWLSQEMFNEAADRCLADEDATLDTITPYRVAQALGRNANATVYKHHRAWKTQKLAEAGEKTFALPIELVEPLEHIFDRFKAQFMAAAVTTIGATIRTLDDAANVRVAEAIRGRSEAEAYTGELLDAWEKDCLAFEEVQKLFTAQAAELVECRTEKLRLEGRLEQIMVERERVSTTDVEGAEE